MSNLLNLRHLILSSCYTIEYPVGIGKLTDIQTMPSFYVSSQDNRAKLGELKDINNIRGEFAIEGLQSLADVNEAKKACLHKKKDIQSLHLGWNYWTASSYIDEEVLESLKPSVKLKSLKISGFKGPSYPSWLGDRSFSRMGTVKLKHCEKWISLPPLGQLPSLKSLYISEARAVEYIGSEFFSGGFPQLEELTLREMDNWKSWCGAQKRECPKLKKLSISGCKDLESLSLINLGALEDICIFGCPKLQFMSGNSLELSHLQCAQTIKIKDIYQVGLIDASHFSTDASLENQPRLKLKDVSQREAEYMLGMCSYICQLTVKRCLNLTSLPLGNQRALEYVAITECPQLRITSISPQLWQLPSLQKIYVNDINGAETINLSETSHMELTNVDQLMASSFLLNFSHMIRQVTITRCANLTSLPLMELELRVSSGSLQLPQFTNVDQLEASFLLHEFCHTIRRLTITRCAYLTSLPWTDLTTLEYLAISECPLFQLLDAEQLPLTLQVLCIYGNPYEREQCNRHQHFQRLKQVQQCSNKEGGEHNLYLVFRNVHNASKAVYLGSLEHMKIHTLEIEWDCCTNHRSNVVDSVAEEVFGKLYSLCISSKKLVIRGYTGSGFAGWFASWYDFFHSRLTSVSLLQCSKCEILPALSQLPFLQELYVEGASNLESVVHNYLLPYDDDDMSERKWQATYTNIAFPRLQKLEFHDMPVWKELLGTKEDDFPFLQKLILKQCPRLRALPHLPLRLEELILEGCEELRSLSSSKVSWVIFEAVIEEF
ncbi:hypothetical protein Taro_004664 [Colocasia esculenta]|uniref:R13L1/DRL21-like LRR repeat region domain-containing protein n=1 Tax=Colocasia esculenta TaxID=4460 RepID=A0A843TKR8_COLES|nr:hypothetical protein [Colocasia esculenta]